MWRRGYPFHEWRRGMRWMGRGWGWPGGYYGGWGWHRPRPCCCLFFALPLLVLPFLAVAALTMHFL